MRRESADPNLVFVLTDDQGYGDLSCLGNPILRTPHIDRLHSQSVRFTDFHVAPMCTPTRGELMTGRDALRNGATFVCMGKSLLRADLPTMADIFAANGYHTGHFGKWHLGDNYPYRPQDRGFHESIYHPGWGITSAPDYFNNDYFDAHYRHKDEIEHYMGYCTDVWFDEAISWMRGCSKRNEPFFAYIATNAPHGPLWVPDEYRLPYLGEVKRDEASFFGMIASIDENMERLDSFLHVEELIDNTILIFMTDNGTATGQNVFNAGMRGMKTSLYEGGHRVPFFLRWPAAGIGGGHDIACMARGTDLLPTLIDLCGLRVEEGVEFDGRSLSEAIHGDESSFTDRMSIVQYGHPNRDMKRYSAKHWAAVLWDKWRLVNGSELYNVVNDIGQNIDLSSAHPDLAKRMREHYEEWWEGVAGSVETHQRLRIGSTRENPMRLSSSDWAWVYCDNPKGIRGCCMDSGIWHVFAEQSGMYTFTLRRWPEESGLGVRASAPVLEGVDGTIMAGKALPVATAWLKVGVKEATKHVGDADIGVTFDFPMEVGDSEIQSWWYDDEGTRLAGAYYLTVERKS